MTVKWNFFRKNKGEWGHCTGVSPSGASGWDCSVQRVGKQSHQCIVMHVMHDLVMRATGQSLRPAISHPLIYIPSNSQDLQPLSPPAVQPSPDVAAGLCCSSCPSSVPLPAAINIRTLPAGHRGLMGSDVGKRQTEIKWGKTYWNKYLLVVDPIYQILGRKKKTQREIWVKHDRNLGRKWKCQ